MDPEAWAAKLRIKQKEEMAQLQMMRDRIKVNMILKEQKNGGQQSPREQSQQDLSSKAFTRNGNRFEGQKGLKLFDEAKLIATDIFQSTDAKKRS